MDTQSGLLLAADSIGGWQYLEVCLFGCKGRLHIILKLALLRNSSTGPPCNMFFGLMLY